MSRALCEKKIDREQREFSLNKEVMAVILRLPCLLVHL